MENNVFQENVVLILTSVLWSEIKKNIHSSDVKRGQILEAEAEAEDKPSRPRTRPRTKLRGRGQGRGQFSNTKDHL